jgi:hypothetical protein
MVELLHFSNNHKLKYQKNTASIKFCELVINSLAILLREGEFAKASNFILLTLSVEEYQAHFMKSNHLEISFTQA